ncbi:helix-turn-helix transcriptional regulator [Methanoregula formicica]|uniref:Putative membrane-associated protein/domain protein n=1 Tax=Methanoregula formicica (strain DSM 22288 / NBRC 105244 / SMSP) TaxID=593750 RepID=L0HHL2_METFS|nr:MarR family transcriptional regulator [Methanoregula formicica]AGB03525.1 putative membrane-associated protein/domain protein [Methanoregula formicica SMSP]
MNRPFPARMLVTGALLLLCILPSVQAASDTGYSTTYTISITKDGSAHWQIEYRTPLLSEEDLAGFENYSRGINTVYLPELRDLMQRSAEQAALGTSRDMTVTGFTGNALVQTSPTGRFGVVTYTFEWTHFAQIDDGIVVGDAFVGGMYLARDNTLIIRYPEGYTVASVSPVPDRTSDALTWYGLRSFGPGQPSIVLNDSSLPFLPVMGGIAVLVIIIMTAIILYRRRNAGSRPEEEFPEADDAEEPPISLSKVDLETLEEKILQLLISHNGEVFQSEIVKVLGLPKSTVSTTLNDLHQRGIIQKVRKGRENLIRLVKDRE